MRTRENIDRTYKNQLVANITKTINNKLSELQQSVTFSNRLLKVENSLSAHECKKLHAQMGTRSQIYKETKLDAPMCKNIHAHSSIKIPCGIKEYKSPPKIKWLIL